MNFAHGGFSGYRRPAGSLREDSHAVDVIAQFGMKRELNTHHGDCELEYRADRMSMCPSPDAGQCLCHCADCHPDSVRVLDTR
jgi:hypothetical protein